MAQKSSTYSERAGGQADWRGTARYEVLGCLGKGGMGVVYEAFDRERRQTVALKTLLHFSPAALYRFKQEFRTLADVHHRNLVRLYELVVTETDGVFFAMELVRGTDLLTYVQKPGWRDEGYARSHVTRAAPARPDLPTMTPGEVSEGEIAPARSAPKTSPADFDKLRSALRQLVEGMQALHSAGKLHRDVKPSNVLVAPDGRVSILDFGVATELSRVVDANLSEEHEIVGTVRYMAPEQAFGGGLTTASDWYSIGVVLYEALVGQPPFVGTAVDVLSMKTLAVPLPPGELVEGVPADLDALCCALLEREPERRPTGLQILRRLGTTRSMRPVPSLPPAADRATSTALVGREEQLTALRDAFGMVRSGRSMTVRVGGASGMGKSALVHAFLDELVEGGKAVVLRGRAYERESVPYKAVDSAIDALSRYLMHLEEQGDAVDLPSEVWALGRVFPVLPRVPRIGAAPQGAVTDPQLLRRCAFAALRELLGSLAARQPLVLFVDDAQWGDVDSAALLLELLRPPEGPPLLLLMTYRDSEAETSPFLREIRDRWPDGADVRDIAVGPLDLADAQRLALTLLDASDETTHRTARAVARESRGSPFLIEELVRSNRGVVARADQQTLAVLTLDQMVSQRLERLPDPARRMLEIVAVGGRPLAVSVVAEASGLRDAVEEAIALARACRFVHAGLRDGREVVETSHDRFRETIVAQLSAETLREHHGRLARVLAEAPGVDAEAIAVHWLGAGDSERAARFAEDAAQQASAKLAFDQAARLYRFALENLPAASPDTRRLRVCLAQSLKLGGRATDSARVYLELAEGAPATQQVEYQRAAAEQLLAAGRIDEGSEILHRVLAAVGMSAPRSPLAALFWLIVYRLWVAVLGLRFKERGPDDVRPEDRLRLDALWTVSQGFGLVDFILGACMQARHFVEAFRKGDRFQVMLAASSQAAHLAATGKPETKRERALAEVARRLAERDGTPLALAYVEWLSGLGLFMRGLWKQSNAALQRLGGAAMLGRSEASQARLFLARTYYFLGDPKECTKREARLYAEAVDRGDLHTTVNMRTSTHVRKWLALDEPERARRDVREALAEWSQKGFLVQHWQAMVYAPDIDLYVGKTASAYERFTRDQPALRKSLLLHSGFVRALTWHAHGRLAIASIESCPERRDARIDEARRMARRLGREYNPWTAMLAALVEAAAQNAAGDRPGAIAALRRAIERAQSTDCVTFVPIARHRLGELVGGDEGGELVRTSLRTMTEWGIRNPSRWLAVYMPGQWGSGV